MLNFFYCYYGLDSQYHAFFNYKSELEKNTNLKKKFVNASESKYIKPIACTILSYRGDVVFNIINLMPFTMVGILKSLKTCVDLYKMSVKLGIFSYAIN